VGQDIINMTPKNEEFKAIKVPKGTYESLKELKKVIIQQGLSNISNDFIDYVPKHCPECGSEMNSVELKVGYYHCPNCQFKYPKVSIGLGGGIALGTLIGLGIAGIIYLLTKKDKEE